jgi:hypothetical protein
MLIPIVPDQSFQGCEPSEAPAVLQNLIDPILWDTFGSGHGLEPDVVRPA